MTQLNLPARGHDDRVLDHVLEFADVAAPHMLQQALQHGRVIAHDLALVLLGVPLQEQLGEHRDVLTPFAQGRDVEDDGVDAEEEILAEPVVGHEGLEARVGGADQTEIRRRHARLAEAPHLLLLQHAQQLDLRVGRHLADLVEEQRAAIGRLDQAALVGQGPREGAALVAEQLGLEQLARNGPAVDLDDRTVDARTALVDGVGDQFLARAVLAANQDRGIGRRHQRDQVEQPPHRRRRADEPSEPVAPLVAHAEARCLGVQVAMGEGLVEDRLEHCELDGLLDEVEGAFAHGFDGQRHAAVPREHHHFDQRVGILEMAQDLETALIGQLVIEQHDVRAVRREGGQRRLAVGRHGHLVLLALEGQLEPLVALGLVIDVEDTGGRHGVACVHAGGPGAAVSAVPIARVSPVVFIY